MVSVIMKKYYWRYGIYHSFCRALLLGKNLKVQRKNQNPNKNPSAYTAADKGCTG
jgi:hypothetical protein